MKTFEGLGFQNHSNNSSSNYAEGSGTSYIYTPHTNTNTNEIASRLTGTVQELNQSNPNLQSQNFSSAKFSQDSYSRPGAGFSFPGSGNGSSSKGLMTSNSNNSNSNNGVNMGLVSSNNEGLLSSSSPSRKTTAVGATPSLFQKPKDTSGTFPVGTKCNNQHDTDSKWTNAYVFNTGITPGSLSSSVMDSLKPKWGPTRDELKDQLANSLASDTNVSILPGYGSKHNHGGGDGSRRHFHTSVSLPYMNLTYDDGTEIESPERVPSAVTRAQNAIGRSRLEIGQAQGMIDMNKAKAQGIYRSPRGDAWSTIGTPGNGIENFSVKRYKQDSYRQDLERQIQQKRLQTEEERRLQIEGHQHPFGVKYNSPVPEHLSNSGMQPFVTNQKPNLFADYSKSKNRQSPAKPVADEVIGRAVDSNGKPFSQRRHFPQAGNLPANPNPINHELPVIRQSFPLQRPMQQHQQQSQPPQNVQNPQSRPQPQQQFQQQPFHVNRYPPPSTAPIQSEQLQPPSFVNPYDFPYGPVPAYPYQWPPPPHFQGFPQYPMQPSPMMGLPPPPMRPPFSYQHLQPSQQQIPAQFNPNAFNSYRQSQLDESIVRPESDLLETKISGETKPQHNSNDLKNMTKNASKYEDDHEDEDGCTIPMRMRIWQTSDQLPDPEARKSVYKRILSKQIIEKQKERAERLAKEFEEDQKQERRIQEYQALMKSEIEMEREELARRCGNKEKRRDLALQKAAEYYRMTGKIKLDHKKHDDDNKYGCGDGEGLYERKSDTSVSSSDYETIISESNTEIEYPAGRPAILLPAMSNPAGSAALQAPTSNKQAWDINQLSQIQRILASETRRLEHQHNL